jgi:hypothetical protein
MFGGIMTLGGKRWGRILSVIVGGVISGIAKVVWKWWIILWLPVLDDDVL